MLKMDDQPCFAITAPGPLLLPARRNCGIGRELTGLVLNKNRMPAMNLGRKRVLRILLCLFSLPAAGVLAEEIAVQPLSIRENTIMFYYTDLSVVVPFYEETLGLEKTFDQDWVKIYRLTPTSNVGLVREGDEGYHHAQAGNAVMLSIVTDQVDAWYQRLKAVGGVTFLKEIYNNEHVPIRAFLIEDPGGYSIEFYQWLEANK